MSSEKHKQTRQDLILETIEKLVDDLEERYDCNIEYNIDKVSFY